MKKGGEALLSPPQTSCVVEDDPSAPPQGPTAPLRPRLAFSPSHPPPSIISLILPFISTHPSALYDTERLNNTLTSDPISTSRRIMVPTGLWARPLDSEAPEEQLAADALPPRQEAPGQRRLERQAVGHERKGKSI